MECVMCMDIQGLHNILLSLKGLMASPALSTYLNDLIRELKTQA
jgi:hypothetical protein